MQINYRNALVLTLMLALQCNGMEDATKKLRKQKELARAQARYHKQQGYNDSEYGQYEDEAQRTLTHRAAKRTTKNKQSIPK